MNTIKTRILFFVISVLFTLSSCTKDEEKHLPGIDEAEVQMTFLTSAHTRVLSPDELEGISQGTEDERKINTLDLLVFKNNAFLYRRPAVKQGAGTDNTFSATLRVDSELTVYFVANARSLIEKLIANGDITDESYVSWEDIREKLIDDEPSRFVINEAERKNLPMWGVKAGLDVTENTITHWTGINLLRAVAGVDIYLDPSVTNFILNSVSLYFVPDKGYWAPSVISMGTDADIITSESADGMRTSLTLGPISADDGKVANKFYLYDNDTNEATFVGDGEHIRRYTRVVVEGVYNSQIYYYPIDFLVENMNDNTMRYDQIVRNTKYLFQITEVNGPGYPTPEVASKEPPVHMTTHVYDWNMHDDKHVGYDGIYYISLNKKAITVSRYMGATDVIEFSTNAHPEIVTINFTSSVNGEQVGLSTGLGIKNDRFSVEKVLSEDGLNIVRLKITALGDYDPADAQRNNDVFVVQAGNVRFTISITQLSGSPSDWESGGQEDAELEGNN